MRPGMGTTSMQRSLVPGHNFTQRGPDSYPASLDRSLKLPTISCLCLAMAIVRAWALIIEVMG